MMIFIIIDTFRSTIFLNWEYWVLLVTAHSLPSFCWNTSFFSPKSEGESWVPLSLNFWMTLVLYLNSSLVNAKYTYFASSPSISSMCDTPELRHRITSE